MEQINPTLVLAISAWLIASAALAAAYYLPSLTTPLWTESYRKYKRQDHVGFGLEWIFVSLTAAALVAMALLEPETSAKLLFVLPASGITWTAVGLGAFVIYFVLMHVNLAVFREQAAHRIRNPQRRAYVNNLTSDGRLRRQYAIYVVYAMGHMLCLALATYIFIFSSVENVHLITTTRHALISGFTRAHVAYLSAGELGEAISAALLHYAKFYDLVVFRGTRTLLALGCLLLPATWMLWRPVQEMYVPLTISIARHYACAMLLCVLPLVLGFTYGTIAWTWETVERETDQLGQAFVLQAETMDQVKDLLALKLSMMGDVSPRGLVERLAFNAGIFVLAGQLGFAVLQQRRIHRSFWSNLLPTWVKRVLRLLDIARIR